MRSRLMLLQTDQDRDLGATAENVQIPTHYNAVMKQGNENWNQSSKETEVENK